MCDACPIIDWAELLPSVRDFTPARVDAAVSGQIVWFDRYTRGDAPRVGGKNASLGEMTAAGLPVPPGFAVTTDAYARIWRDRGLVDDVNSMLRSIEHDDAASNRRVSAEIRSRIEAAPFPGDCAGDIAEAYQALCRHCGVDDVPVAIRSSATAEDMPEASFAGQQDSYLWIRGADDVVRHVQRCWSSLFTDRAIAYRYTMGYLHQPVAMSVGVQKMVDPVAAGVAFTLNPINGDRSQVAIDTSWGLGEAVVSGEVNPDNFLVDKVLRTVVSRKISDKHTEYVVTDSGVVEKLDVPPERRNQPSLNDDDLVRVAILARRAEKHYGCPQDVEWALDRHLPPGENVVMLQSRPETVWSTKAPPPVSKGDYDPMSSIVATLVSPLAKRQKSNPGGISQ